MAGPAEATSTYARLVDPVRFFTCDACKGMVRETKDGFVRDAPFGEPCSCETPTFAPRRVTHVSTLVRTDVDAKVR